MLNHRGKNRYLLTFWDLVVKSSTSTFVIKERLGGMLNEHW